MTRSSFEMYRQLGIGWRIVTNNPQEVTVIRKHLKRMKRLGLIPEFSSRRYFVAVGSRFFGLHHHYTVIERPYHVGAHAKTYSARI